MKHYPAAEIKRYFESLKAHDYRPFFNDRQNAIQFYCCGDLITFYPGKQYFSGKGLENGYGFNKMLEELENKQFMYNLKQ